MAVNIKDAMTSLHEQDNLQRGGGIRAPTCSARWVGISPKLPDDNLLSSTSAGGSAPVLIVMAGVAAIALMLAACWCSHPELSGARLCEEAQSTA